MSRSNGAQPGSGPLGPGRAHPAIEEQLAAYTAGELPPAERQRIQAHLASCAPCAAALAEVQRIRSLLQTLTVPSADAGASQSVAGAVLARLAEPLPADATATGDLWLAQDGEDVAPEWDPRPLSWQDGVVSAAQRPAPPATFRRGWDRVTRWQSDGASAGESFQMQHRNARVADEPPADPSFASNASRRTPPNLPANPFMRTRGLPAVAATLAIVVLSAALFGMLSARPHPRAGSGPSTSTLEATPTVPPTPRRTPMPGATLPALPGLPGGSAMSSIWMDGPNDGWAAGWTDAVASGQLLYTGRLLHYTGGRWVLSPDSFPGVMLADISMDSPDDGWAVGVHADGATGVVLHFTAGHWTEVKAPITHFTGTKVWAVSPSQAWVVAQLPPSSQQGLSQSNIWLSYRSGGLASVVLLYNQGNWSQFSSPSGITDISPLSPDDIWATTYNGLILHLQAGHWTTFFVSGELQGEQPQSLHMTSDSDGWAAGFANTSPQGMFLAHFDGNQWTRVQGPTTSGGADLPAIDMVSPDEGWAGGVLTGQSDQQIVLLHYVGGRWQEVPLNYSGTIQSIFMVSASEGWAAALGGRVPGLLHYHNGRWTPYVPGQ